MTAFVDTNVPVRHLTGDPSDMAERATAYLRDAPELLLTDLVVAEVVYVLESFYEAPRAQVAESVRSLIALRSVSTVDPALLLRAIEVYEIHRLDFAEAYLVACAEVSHVGRIASFDKSLDRVTTITRIEPTTADSVRDELSEVLSADSYRRYVDTIDDPDLRDE